MKAVFIFLVLASIGFSFTAKITTIDVSNAPSVNISNVLLEEGSMSGIDFAHLRIHEGKTFRVATLNKSLADNAYYNITFRPTDNIHFTAEVNSSGKAYVLLYEGITQSAGIAYTPRNMRRSKTRVAGTTVTLNATVTQASCEQAILLGAWLINGGTGPQSIGGAIRSGSEFVFKADTEYVLRLQNVAGGAKDNEFNLQWYTED